MKSRLTLIIAGRSRREAERFCAALPASAMLVPAAFDREGDIEAQLGALAPDLVVDASGPFQIYGDPYGVVRAALARRIGYLDLADGADFVQGIAQFDAQARERCVFVLAGASSFPVLTAAVVRRLARAMTRVDAVSAGIAPSPFAGLGLNVIRAIASYCGKPIELLRDGRKTVGFGLTEVAPLHHRAARPPSARQPALLAGRCAGSARSPRAVAVAARGLDGRRHRAGNHASRARTCSPSSVRLRLLPSLLPFARLMHWASNRLRWGEHRGGMYVEVQGARAGKPVTRSWHMIAEGDDGPFIPVDGLRGDHPELPCRETSDGRRATGHRRRRARRL